MGSVCWRMGPAVDVPERTDRMHAAILNKLGLGAYNLVIMGSGSGKKVLVAMSGGVDSSVAAALLQDEGYKVVGCFMRLGTEQSFVAAQTDRHSASQPSNGGDPPAANSAHQGCCSLGDACDARLVCAMLDVPFYVLNFKEGFRRIIDYFVDEYNTGRTPNPCIRCNSWLKFGKLAAYARSIDADYVATGHYARVEHANGRSRLLRGVDRNKDQSYVLFGVHRQVLRHVLLPVGQYVKGQIRQIARDKGLPVFDKPDSQEICFVPDNDYMRLVRERSPRNVRDGEITDLSGRHLGTHKGHQHFTVGQRRGLHLSLGYPLYVVNKDAATNTVTVGPKQHVEAIGLVADQANWLADPPTRQPVHCQVKIRSNSNPQPGQVRAVGKDSFEVVFDQAQHAVTPGQAGVCYDGEELIGGGWIDRVIRK